MKNQNSESESTNNDWKAVVVEIILKILTLGFYHIEKHHGTARD